VYCDLYIAIFYHNVVQFENVINILKHICSHNARNNAIDLWTLSLLLGTFIWASGIYHRHCVGGHVLMCKYWSVLSIVRSLCHQIHMVLYNLVNFAINCLFSVLRLALQSCTATHLMLSRLLMLHIAGCVHSIIATEWQSLYCFVSVRMQNVLLTCTMHGQCAILSTSICISI